MRRRSIRVGATLVVTGLCTAYILWKIDLGKTVDILRNADLGYFFAAEDSVSGVDLDVSLDINGNPLPWAAEIINRFQDTYRALSVSGSGLHVLCHAALPGKGRNFNVPNGPTDPSGKRAQIGLFDRTRFFALTGHLYQQSPVALADHQQTINWLLGLMRSPPKLNVVPVVTL